MSSQNRQADAFTDEDKRVVERLTKDVEWVRLSDICHNFLGEQAQYIYYHFAGIKEPIFTDVRAQVKDIHSTKIHSEDVYKMITALRTHRWRNGLYCA